mmetsp:Transcript_922/g.1197  ORF Transcript_922/g.1197 Transcript_922/m.1197 type:complete len:221 (+) Transcript_922:316-978(+)
MTELVKFDIGGQFYKVSRSLLDKHPESMLFKSASKQWQEDPEAEIFIEGNGFRFQFILDYMRNDKLDLPITESKKTIIAELEYYGITVNEDSIDDTAANNLKYTKSMEKMMRTLEGDISSSGEKHYAAKVAVDCIKQWCTESPFLSTYVGKCQTSFDKTHAAREDLRKEELLIHDNVHDLHNAQNDQTKREASVNFYLNQVSLQVFDLGKYEFKVEQLDA